MRKSHTSTRYVVAGVQMCQGQFGAIASAIIMSRPLEPWAVFSGLGARRLAPTYFGSFGP